MKHLVRKVVQTDKRSVVTTAQLYKCGLYVETQSEPVVLTVASLNILERMFFKNQPGASKNCAWVNTSAHQNLERQGSKQPE